MKYDKSFKKNPRYPHQRSEGTTRRGAARQDRLMAGPAFDPKDPFALDRQTRIILQGVTRENALGSAAALAALGYGTTVAWNIIEKIVADLPPTRE